MHCVNTIGASTHIPLTYFKKKVDATFTKKIYQINMEQMSTKLVRARQMKYAELYHLSFMAGPDSYQGQ